MLRKAEDKEEDDCLAIITHTT
uniref:Uncharacterized protein n=1 Tax=Physcomitrium patens TaxID=3218 RepID=A0A2K1IU79_PHYPA|nr:hypothetical protein PHYPA_024772 [Physcomitrium patens]